MASPQPMLSKDLDVVALRFIKDKGLARHIHDPMETMEQAINQIITYQFSIDQQPFMPERSTQKAEQREIRSITYKLTFVKVRMQSKRRTSDTLSGQPLDPYYALLNKQTYGADLFISSHLRAVATLNDGTQLVREIPIDEVHACTIPIEVGNPFCTYDGKSRGQIYRENGDIDLLDGLFIVGGSLYSIETQEKLKFNGLHVYRNSYKGEMTRATMLMREGVYCNSFQMIIRHMENGLINIEMSIRPFVGFPIPIHLFFYMLGVTSDSRIEELVLQTQPGAPETDTTRMLRQTLKLSYDFMVKSPLFSAPAIKRNPVDVMIWLHNHVRGIKPDETKPLEIITAERNHAVQTVSYMLDNNFMVHQTGVDAVTNRIALRPKKAILLGSIIYDTIMTTAQGVIGTDRDSIRDKRYQTAGMLLMRDLKRAFNDAIVKPLKKELTTAFKNSEFKQVAVEKIVRERIARSNLTEMFERDIKAFQDKAGTIDRRRTIHSEALNLLKSPIYILSAKRKIGVLGIVSKSSERATQMRLVHPTFEGFICSVASPDTGEEVGMARQLALLTNITNWVPPEEIIDRIMHWPGLTAWNMVRDNSMRVHVNGNWLGCISEPYAFLREFRALRRAEKAYRTISIVFNKLMGRIEIWTEEGRPIRPYFIVYNNMSEIDAFDDELAREIRSGLPMQKALAKQSEERPAFHQWIKYDKSWRDRLMLEPGEAGAASFDDLLDAGVMEYFTAEEIQDCFLAYSHEQLIQLRHDETKQFTHMSIPISSLSVSALTATLPNFSQPIRACFQTSMGKQTTGFVTTMEPHLDLKQAHFQACAYVPINPTFANMFTEPGGAPVRIALGCMGWNQEDSLVFSEGFIQRNGFMCSTISKIIAECRGADEIFGQPPSPDARMQNANYSKLKNGIVPIGTVIRAGNVLIAKYSEQKLDNGRTQYIDQSAVYQHHETAYVTNVMISSAASDVRRITVQYRLLRLPNTGSKYSSRSGNKGVASRVMADTHMPYGSRTGMRADIVIGPHSFPSRMMSGETISDQIGNLASATRSVMMVTPFMELDLREVAKLLEAAGRQAYGLEPMRDGRTGILTRPLYMATTTRQCLQKFAEAEASARTSGKISSITRQALSGASNSGGQRTGEMEFWVMDGLGAAEGLNEFQGYDKSYFEIVFCKRCGQRGIYNRDKNIWKCRVCTELADLVRMRSKYFTNSAFSYMEAAGFKLTLRAEAFCTQRFVGRN